MSELKTLEIDVVSDVMCPWCYIGKNNLDKAIERMDGVNVVVRWRPYQLDSTLPKEGKDRAEYLNTKFGGEEKARGIYNRIREAGKANGIDFNFDDIKESIDILESHVD